MREKAQALLCKAFDIKFPYIQMGKIDSLHLFGLDTEMVIFALYKHNEHRWKRVLDIGANLGLHSIFMAKLGWKVSAYEPDFDHYHRLIENLDRNHVSNLVRPFMSAVSTSNGSANFVRVLNNLTGNHLEGYKNSYGPTEKLIVPTVDCKDLWPIADFAKIDCEGNEAELCRTMDGSIDCILEVRNESNAKDIYEHFMQMEVPMWSQKNDWLRVTKFEQMPTVNRQGSLFVGKEGPWI